MIMIMNGRKKEREWLKIYGHVGFLNDEEEKKTFGFQLSMTNICK